MRKRLCINICLFVGISQVVEVIHIQFIEIHFCKDIELIAEGLWMWTKSSTAFEDCIKHFGEFNCVEHSLHVDMMFKVVALSAISILIKALRLSFPKLIVRNHY